MTESMFYEEGEEDEFLDEDSVEEQDQEDELDELSKEFVTKLIDKMMQFMDALVGHSLHPYQVPLARRIIESVIIIVITSTMKAPV